VQGVEPQPCGVQVMKRVALVAAATTADYPLACTQIFFQNLDEFAEFSLNPSTLSRGQSPLSGVQSHLSGAQDRGQPRRS